MTIPLLFARKLLRALTVPARRGTTLQTIGRNPSNRLRRKAVTGGVASILWWSLVVSDISQAGTITVTSAEDDGAGSLRAAVAAASSGDEIRFSLPAPSTITLTTGELTVTNNLTITGPGPASLAISGNTNSRVFNVPANGTLTLSGLTIRDGRATTETGGGGVFNAGTLTLSNCDVCFNDAGVPGGGGGGIYNSGILSAAGCTFRSNRGGTGISGVGGDGGYGGAIYNGGSLSLNSSTFTDNRAGTGGNGSSTSSGGVGGSGGRGGAGGAIFNAGSMGCTSCTLKGNGAGAGGNGGSAWAPNPWIVGTGGAGGTGGSGGGIGNSGTITVRNSIIALNLVGERGWGGSGPANGPGGAPGSSPDVFGAFISQGRNLIGENNGSTGLTNGQNGNIVGTTNNPINPRLGALQDNGGPTWTMSLLTGSPALNAGDDTLTGTDQRGFPRLSGARVDMGAYEGFSERYSRAETLLAGDGLNNSIAAIELRSGATIGTFVQPAAGVNYQTFGPRGMLCVANQLLVVNQNVDQPYNGEILKFDLHTGAFTGKLVPGSNANAPWAPRGMIAGPNGVLYVADVGGFDGTHPGRIARYSSQGAFLGNVITSGLSVPFYPMGLVIGPDGMLYVSGVGNFAQGSVNGFIHRFQFYAGTQNYHFVNTIVSSTAANYYAPGLHSPEGIVFGPDGNIYVVSFQAAFSDSQGLSVTDRDAILVFNKNGLRVGSPIYLYPTGEPRVFAQAILFGPRGDLFVPITSDRGIRRYSASSSYQQFTVLPSAGASPGQPWYLTFRATHPGTLAYQPPQLTPTLNGARIDLSWPADYVGWQLQMQINGDLGESNWVNVSESLGTNTFSLLRNPSDSRAFFRLVAP